MAYYNNRKAGVKRSTADQWFSKAIRLRDNDTCQCCGLAGGDSAHIVGRRVKATRWSAINALCLCRSCHNTLGEHPLDFAALITRLYGPEREDVLTFKRRGILKDNAETQKKISDHYRLEYNRMRDTGDRDLESYN